MRRLLDDLRRSVANYDHVPRLEDYAFLRPVRTGTKFGRPLVSIITCVYNAAESLPRTMASVRAQTYPWIEYVLVDGASIDGTHDVIAANRDIVDVLLSEKDDGLYDAFNRGVAVATGDYIAVLNADDAIAPDHIERSIAALKGSGADFSFGDVEMIHQTPDGEQVSQRPADHDYAQTLPFGTTDLHHATMVVKREAFESVGLFRTGLKIAADYDWFIRMHNAGFKGVYSGVLSRMSHGGVSTERQELSILEASYVALRNGGNPLRVVGFWGPMLGRRLAWRVKRAMLR